MNLSVLEVAIPENVIMKVGLNCFATEDQIWEIEE